MEFPFDLNVVLPDEITRVTGTFRPFRRNNHESIDDLEEKLCKVIDTVGVASTRAQGLSRVITTATKLKGSDQILYICQDKKPEESSVIGILRVGIKKLFVVDLHGQQIEVHPLCVLDFYVHETKQRSGYGKKLFDYMLKVENLKPEHIAVDRPSPKFLSFLCKHYGLKNAFPQFNKFVVFDQFFRDLSAVGYVPSKRRFAASAPALGRLISDSTGGQRPHTGLHLENRNLSCIHLNRQRSQAPYGESKLLIEPKSNTLPRMVSSRESCVPDERGKQRILRTPRENHRLKDQQKIFAYSRHSYNTPPSKTQKNEMSLPPKEQSPQCSRKPPLPCATKPQTLEMHQEQENSKRNSRETSFDNPLAFKPRCPESNNSIKVTPGKVENTKSNEPNSSYTVDGVLSHSNVRRPPLGTSWNVFGVPSGLQYSETHPYLRYVKSRLPR